MSILFPPFFETNSYFIDEKVQFFKFHNHYKVYDEHGLEIGSVIQRVSGWHKALRLVLNKAMLPFTLEIIDLDEKALVTIQRGWTFWMSKITLTDGDGNVIGRIKQKFKFFKPTFRILDALDNEIAVITGDWKAWNFTITDSSGMEIGTISKKWAGIAKEVFTSADKYNVNIVPEVAEDTKKMAIVSTAITIDMVLKESK